MRVCSTLQTSDSGKSAKMVKRPERSVLSGKRERYPFRHDYAKDCVAMIRLLTRQMGWPTLGCNQQDLWNAVKGLFGQKPACMVPMRRGMKQIRCS